MATCTNGRYTPLDLVVALHSPCASQDWYCFQNHLDQPLAAIHKVTRAWPRRNGGHGPNWQRISTCVGLRESLRLGEDCKPSALECNLVRQHSICLTMYRPLRCSAIARPGIGPSHLVVTLPRCRSLPFALAHVDHPSVLTPLDLAGSHRDGCMYITEAAARLCSISFLYFLLSSNQPFKFFYTPAFCTLV